jgi:hypothetical protein
MSEFISETMRLLKKKVIMLLIRTKRCRGFVVSEQNV